MDPLGLLVSLVSLFQICLLARAILSWMPAATRFGVWRDVYGILLAVTEPVLRPLRRIVPPVGGVIDPSPILALLLLSLIMSLIVRL